MRVRATKFARILGSAGNLGAAIDTGGGRSDIGYASRRSPDFLVGLRLRRGLRCLCQRADYRLAGEIDLKRIVCEAFRITEQKIGGPAESR